MFEHKQVSLADQVFERIEEDILSGKLARGEVITEMWLSQTLGVSRTPVREALSRLSNEHLIEERAKGIVVLGITNDDIEDIFSVRLKIEGDAAKRAAEKIGEEELKELSETIELQEFYTEKKDAERIRAMDSRFHQLMYKAGGSAIYYDTLVPLHRKAQRYRRMSVENKARAGDSLVEHRKIYEAIIARDGDAAKKAAEEHVKNAAYHILMGENK